MKHNRRTFLKAAGTVAAMNLLPELPAFSLSSPARPIRVVVWDERQPEQKPAYEDFIGNYLAAQLQKQPNFSVQSVALDDQEQGLPDNILNNCDVLIWWGHVRHGEIKPELGRKIVDRITAGSTALIALHAAHWSTPFVEAMNERTRQQAKKLYPTTSQQTVEFSFVPLVKSYTMPKYDSRLTPYFAVRKFPDGKEKVEVHLPNCCFPAYRGDGKPSSVQILKPKHPIVTGVPAKFEIPQTEMYDEPFHVPDPDEVILEERWATGEWFRSGMLWSIGRGKVFYFRPGHELYPVYKEKWPMQIIANAARWLGSTIA
ncbi:MAG: ThuA domain-containing protein [Bacteroidota bacterium]|nr:ThuA domain-containing protein [Bacteroidota bacterium]